MNSKKSDQNSEFLKSRLISCRAAIEPTSSFNEFALSACFLGQTWWLQPFILKPYFLKYKKHSRTTKLQIKCVLLKD